MDGLSAAGPVILPVAVSAHGEFCPGAVQVREWLSAKYRERLVLTGDSDCGEKLEDVIVASVANFAPRSSSHRARGSHAPCYRHARCMPFAVKRGHGRMWPTLVPNNQVPYRCVPPFPAPTGSRTQLTSFVQIIATLRDPVASYRPCFPLKCLMMTLLLI